MNIAPRRWLPRLAVATVVTVGAIVAISGTAQAEVSNIEVREITGTWNVSPNTSSTRTLICASGEKVLEGGVLSMALSTDVYVIASYVSGSTKWVWTVYNDSSSTQEIRARAICATGV